MGAHTEKASCIGGPVLAADTTGMTGVLRVAATGASQSVTPPAMTDNAQKKTTFAGRFMRIRPVGCTIQWGQYFGTAPTVVSNQAAAFGTGHAGAGASLADGEPFEFLVDHRTVGIALLASNATGFIEFYLAETSGRA